MASLTRHFGKHALHMLVVSLFAMLLFGANGSAKLVEIDFWVPTSFADGKQDVLMANMIEQFQRVHSDIKVNVQTTLPDRPARGEKYILAAMSKTLPALGWLAPEEIPGLYNESSIAPIDKFAERDKFDTNQFWPGIWGNGVGGRQWGYPFELGSEALMYNADRFSAGGIVPPATWDQYVIVTRKLTDPVKGLFGLHPLSTSAHNVLRFLWRNGGDILSKDMRTVTFDNPKNVPGLQFFQDMRVSNKVSGGSYQKGTAAMIEVHAGWYADEYTFTKGTAPVPIPAGGVRATRNYYKEVVIFRTTPEKEEAAWTFLKWFMNGENNGRWASTSGYLPVTRDALNSEPYKTYFRNNPMLTPWIDELRYTRYLPPQEIIDVFQKVVDKVVKEVTSPAATLLEWQHAAQATLTEFHTRYPNYLKK